MKNKLFISCEEAAHRIDKAQYGEATFWEKITFKIHNLYCKLCHLYEVKNKKLTHIIKSGKVQNLTKEQKLKIKDKLKETIF
tara:strand:+ start:17177 stop:17422 length:246 start_codon:yes stop_codon:yes gene_type:complete